MHASAPFHAGNGLAEEAWPMQGTSFLVASLFSAVKSALGFKRSAEKAYLTDTDGMRVPRLSHAPTRRQSYATFV
jgi:hypothetical protein